MLKKKAKKISYGRKRNRKVVRAIVFHWTGNNNDTTKNNLDYFAQANNRSAGAHFFVDKRGVVGKSIPMNRVAYAVGLPYREQIYCNGNTVSIEMCSFNKYPSKEQLKSIVKLINYIQKYCPNAKKLLRHWDINGKDCPHGMTGVNNKNWNKFRKELRKYGCRIE